MKSDHLVVAAAHAAPAYMDLRGSVARAAELVRQAASDGARLVVFPEAFLPGFPYWINVVTPVE